MVSSLPPWSYGGVLDTHIAPHRSLPSTWGFPSPPLHHPEAQDCIFPNLDPLDSHEADLGMLQLLEEILHNLAWRTSSINWFINQSSKCSCYPLPQNTVYEAVLAWRIFARPGGTIRHVPSDSPLTGFKILEANAVKQSPCKIDVGTKSQGMTLQYFTLRLILYSPKKNPMSPFNSGNFVEFPGFPNRWELWSELLVQHQCTW